jgi:hypothetical protein
MTGGRSGEVEDFSFARQTPTMSTLGAVVLGLLLVISAWVVSKRRPLKP